MRELGGSGSYPMNNRGRSEQIPDASFAVVAVFCAMTLNICATSVWNSRPVNPLELTVFQYILGSWSSYVPDPRALFLGEKVDGVVRLIPHLSSVLKLRMCLAVTCTAPCMLLWCFI